MSDSVVAYIPHACHFFDNLARHDRLLLMVDGMGLACNTGRTEWASIV